jgi:SAM-dependent methyltransferase
MLTIKRASKSARKVISRGWLSVRTVLGAPRRRWCPACETAIVGFFTYGGKEWGCPNCGASPRERFVNHCIDNGSLELFASAKVLHIAPSETSLVRRFSETGVATFGDLSPRRYGRLGVARIDLMDMRSLGEFDIFYASHVLEHVPDDRQVLRNIRDHLRPGGQAWILVPLHDCATVEAKPGMSELDRETHFGQWDHVRQYGPDIVERLRDAGFDVSLIDSAQVASEEKLRMGLSVDDIIFVASRHPDAAVQ